jgi:hypothetical protein
MRVGTASGSERIPGEQVLIPSIARYRSRYRLKKVTARASRRGAKQE